MRGQPTALRPPGALPEMEFDSACTRCGDCLAACPEKIIRSGRGGLPEIDFAQGACTFCGACATSCRSRAILPAGSWGLRAAVSSNCLETQGVTCRVCETACDELALRFRPLTRGRSMVLVDEDRCTGCGACVAACPVAAITVAEAAGKVQANEEGACPKV